ncbi:MAG TPA: radical SAM protein, partial [bacterium]|nr:radical SAM protein [bacterium]
RLNRQGKLYSEVYGQLIAENVDPIEKKPFYHFLPGSLSYSIATVGCNFACTFCQNAEISQAPKERHWPTHEKFVPPEKVIQQAQAANCLSISYTYTEPTIFLEYALKVARLAKEKGLKNNFVTNGYMSQQALELLAPVLDAAN